MKIRPTVLACGLLALLLASPGVPAAAQTGPGPQVLSQPDPAYQFDGPIRFAVTAQAADEITDVTLFLTTPDEPRTFVGKARFSRGSSVTASYTLEPGRRRILPFAPVTYWWELTDGAGRVSVSAARSFVYADNRFSWKTRRQGALTAAWYQGDEAFGQAILDVAAAGLQRANHDIKASLPDAVTIYAYASQADAGPALAPSGRAWAGGHAAPLFGTVVVVLPAQDVDAPTRMAREVPHELTHVLIAQKAGARVANVPSWLNEGLAVMNENAPEASAAANLAQARSAGRWQSLASLCGPFPADAALAQTAYAESESLVRYLRDRHGSQTITRLLDSYADGLDCQSAVSQALGLSLDQLEQEWAQSILPADQAAPAWHDPGPWVVLAAIILSVPTLMLALLRLLRPARPML